jgi:ureidoglycolate lyase
MKLARIGAPGSERSGLIDAEGRLRDLSSEVPDLTNDQRSDEGLVQRIVTWEKRLKTLFS